MIRLVTSFLRDRRIAPFIAAGLMLAACAPFMPPVGNPFGPQPAAASTPEAMARYSVPAAYTAEQIASVGQLVPGVGSVATLIDRAAEGYRLEMQRQIAGLEERMRQTGQPASSSDWWWAIAFAAAAGGYSVIGGKKLQLVPQQPAPQGGHP